MGSEPHCICFKSITDNELGWKCTQEISMTIQVFDTTVELEGRQYGMGIELPLTEDDSDPWYWDVHITLADILP